MALTNKIVICLLLSFFVLLSSISIFAHSFDSVELLVRTTNGAGGRRRGDIVSMKQIPHKGWGREEGLPNYVIVKIDNITARDFSQYHVRHGKLDENDMSEKPETVRSRFRFNLDNLPTAVSGRITIQKTEAITSLIDRRVEHR